MPWSRRPARGAGGQGRHAGDLRHQGGGGRGAVEVNGQPGGQHVVRGTGKRQRPTPQRAKGPQDVPLLEGLTVSQVSDLLVDVRVQFLLVGPDAADQGRSGAMAETEPGDGRRAGGSRLVDPRAAGIPIRATVLGHKPRDRSRSIDRQATGEKAVRVSSNRSELTRGHVRGILVISRWTERYLV